MNKNNNVKFKKLFPKTNKAAVIDDDEIDEISEEEDEEKDRLDRLKKLLQMLKTKTGIYKCDRPGFDSGFDSVIISIQLLIIHFNLLNRDIDINWKQNLTNWKICARLT